MSDTEMEAEDCLLVSRKGGGESGGPRAVKSVQAWYIRKPIHFYYRACLASAVLKLVDTTLPYRVYYFVGGHITTGSQVRWPARHLPISHADAFIAAA